MKKNIFAICTALCLLVIGCKKNQTAIPNQPTVPVTRPAGVATPVGSPDSEPLKQKTIGASGGTIESNDGRLKITIPAGALTSNQQVSIQSISNHNPLAIKQAYRLQPHDVEFSEPVTIEFSYSEEDIKNTIPEALGIAYQDQNRVWQAQGGVVLDKENQTIKVNTTHFSDWSLFESFYLFCSQSVLPTQGTAQLEVFTTEDLLVPLVPGEEVAMGKKISLAAKYIKEWKLSGAGNLQPNGSKANYKAPGTVPNAPNPVAVSVRLDLNQRGKFLLVKHIEIINDDGEIEFRIAGSGWIKRTASPAVRRPDGTYAIADSDGDVEGSYITINWVDGIGTHPYKSPYSNSGTHMQYLIDNGNNYVCYYMSNNDELVASGGGVTITSMGEDDGFIKGTFVVTPAGYGDNLKSTINIEGKFRVRKGWQ